MRDIVDGHIVGASTTPALVRIHISAVHIDWFNFIKSVTVPPLNSRLHIYCSNRRAVVQFWPLSFSCLQREWIPR